jgi:hypothetical protein
VTLNDRFWAKVEKREADECWPWLGATDGRYGQLWKDGRNERAHKVSWEIHHGVPFPDGMDACHTCDTPSCVNPNHIWPGTASDNARDALAKGRLKIPPLLTHCKHGHELTPENLGKPRGRSRGYCKTCQRERNWKLRGKPIARAALGEDA